MTHRKPRESSGAARAQYAWVFGELHSSSTAATAVIAIASIRGGSVRLRVGCVSIDEPGIFVFVSCCCCLLGGRFQRERGAQEGARTVV